MSRLSTHRPEDATGLLAELFAGIRKAIGKLPNLYAALGAHSPASVAASVELDAKIAASSLSKQDVEVIRLVVSELSGCDYCLAAHTLVGKLAGLAPETMKQVRAGEPSGDARRDALVRVVRALVSGRGTLPQAEFDAVRAAGYAEVQVAEIPLVIAGITLTNLFNRLNDTEIDFPPIR